MVSTIASRNRFVLTTLLAVVLPLVVAGSALARTDDGRGAAHAQATQITISYNTSSPSYAPVLIAQKEGFFAKNGLNVTAVLAANKSTQLLLSGDAQFAFDSGAPEIAADAHGADFVLIGATDNRLELKAVGRAPINSVQDLAGHTLALSTPGAAADLGGHLMLKKFGLLGKVKITYIRDIPTRLAAFTAGSIDALIASPVNSILQIPNTKMIYNLSGIPFLYSSIWTRRGYATSNPATVKAVLRSTGEALVWMRKPANRAKYLDYISQITTVTAPSDLNEMQTDELHYAQIDPDPTPAAIANTLSADIDVLGIPAIDANSFLYLGPLTQVVTRHVTAKVGGVQVSGTLTPTNKLIWKATTTPAVTAITVGSTMKGASMDVGLCRNNCGKKLSGSVPIYDLANAIRLDSAFITVTTGKNRKQKAQIVSTYGG